jgi:phage shock protein A
MGLLKSLITTIRGVKSEVEEEFNDSQAIRMTEQHIRDAKADQANAEASLGAMDAQVTGLKRKAAEVKQKIAEHEGYGTQAMEQGDEALAGEIADKIVDLETELADLDAAITTGEENVKLLKEQLIVNKREIAKMEREKDMIKTTDSLQKSQAAMASQFSGTDSALSTARDSLARKRQSQQAQADRFKSDKKLSQEFSGDGLTDKLQKAGITPGSKSKSDVMARFSKKSTDAE